MVATGGLTVSRLRPLINRGYIMGLAVGKLANFGDDP